MNCRRALLLAPLGLAAAGGIAFWRMLDGLSDGSFDPHDIGNPLVGRPLPEFALAGFDGKPGFGSAELKAAAKAGPILVNFFASWCVPCVAEADTLAAVAHDLVPVWGIVYKDQAQATQGFLDRYGNPYTNLADDAYGRAGIEWGIYGVPESFLIDRNGIVRWHQAGPLTDEAVDRNLRRAVKAVKATV